MVVVGTPGAHLIYTGDNMSLQPSGAMFLGKGFFVASHESKTEPSLGTAKTRHINQRFRGVCVCVCVS